MENNERKIKYNIFKKKYLYCIDVKPNFKLNLKIKSLKKILVKTSIKYFSPKNNEECINTFLTKISEIFLTKKSKNKPDFTILRIFFFLLENFNKQSLN